MHVSKTYRVSMYRVFFPRTSHARAKIHDSRYFAGREDTPLLTQDLLDAVHHLGNVKWLRKFHFSVTDTDHDVSFIRHAERLAENILATRCFTVSNHNPSSEKIIAQIKSGQQNKLKGKFKKKNRRCNWYITLTKIASHHGVEKGDN
jgi:hypothetical protein